MGRQGTDRDRSEVLLPAKIVQNLQAAPIVTDMREPDRGRRRHADGSRQNSTCSESKDALLRRTQWASSACVRRQPPSLF